MAIEYLSLKEAGECLGVSRTKVWQLVKEGVLPAYSDPLDKRKKLIRKDDIQNLRLPQPRANRTGQASG